MKRACIVDCKFHKRYRRGNIEVTKSLFSSIIWLSDILSDISKSYFKLFELSLEIFKGTRGSLALLGTHSLYESWEVYGDPRGHRGRLYEV